MEPLQINQQIKDTLKRNNINLADGFIVLSAMWFNLKPSFLEDSSNYYYKVWNAILLLGIVRMDYESGSLDWEIPLFGEFSISFDDAFVKQFMDKFKAINPERRGDKAAVIRNLKKIRMKFPNITEETINTVTDYYLEHLNNYQFCKKSHKFLWDINGSVFLQTYDLMLEESMSQPTNII